MRFVPINDENKAPALRFVPLEQAAPPQGQIPAPPAAASTSVPVGGEATGTVRRGFTLPPPIDPFGLSTPQPPAPALTDGPELSQWTPTIGQRIGEVLGLGGNRDRASNELAARRIAKRDGVSVDQVYRDVGGNRPIFNPEGRAAAVAVPEAAGVVASDLPRVAPAAARTVLSAIRGGSMGAEDRNFLDRAITWLEAPDKDVDPNYQGLAGIGESLGYSLATIGAFITGSIGGTAATGSPLGGVGAGLSASAGLSFRASKDDFVSRARDVFGKRFEQLHGRPMTDAEWSEVRQDINTAANKYGAWEAVPESLSNLIFVRAFARPLRGASAAKLNDAAQKAAALATEQGTETITGVGQNRAELEVGLTDEELSIVDAFRQQFLQTLIVSGAMGGGAMSAQAARDFYVREVQPRVDPASALGRAIQADLDAAAFSQEGIRQEAVDSLSPANAQLEVRQPAPRFVPLDPAQPQAPMAPSNLETQPAATMGQQPVTAQAGPGFDMNAVQQMFMPAEPPPEAAADVPEAAQPTPPTGETDGLQQEGQEAAQAVTPPTDPAPAADGFDLDSLIADLTPEQQAQFKELERIVNITDFRTAGGERPKWHMAVRSFKEALAKSPEDAQKLMDTSMANVLDMGRRSLMDKATLRFAEQFDKVASDAQIIAAIKNGSLDISNEPWAPGFYEMFKIDPAKIQRRAPVAQGVSQSVAGQLAKFQAGVFERPNVASGANAEGRATAEAMNKQRQADYAAAARIFLEGPLTAKVPTRSQQGIEVDLLNSLTDVRPQPIEKKVPVAKDWLGTLKVADMIAAKNDIRYYLNGLRLNEEKGRIEATDGHRALIIQTDLTGKIPARPEGAPAGSNIYVGTDGKWALTKDGKPLEGQFPDLDRVIAASNRTREVSFDAAEFAALVRGIEKAERYFNLSRTPIPAVIKIDDSSAGFQPRYLAEMAEVFQRLGYDRFNLTIGANTMNAKGLGALQATSPDGKVTQVVMPIRSPMQFFAPIVGDESPSSAQPKKPATKKPTAKRKAVKDFLADEGITDPAVADAVAEEYDRLTGDDDVQGQDAGDAAGAAQRGQSNESAGAVQGGQQATQPELFGSANNRRPAQDAPPQGSADQSQAGAVNDRTPVPSQRDTEAAPANRQRVSGDDGRQENQRIKGAGSEVFSVVSFTNRQSIYKDAWIDLGHDPDQMAMLPPERQFRILAEGLTKTFGLSAVQRSDRSNIRLAIDQLQDAYRNMQFMAAALDLPTKAIGLNGTLALGITSQGKYLGAYYPQGSDGKSSDGLVSEGATIVMPGRSNSFAHEWGHALDFYIVNAYEGAVDNLSGMVRKGETLSDQMPESVQDSFRLLMNALFFDNAQMSARIMDLERRIEAATQKGNDTAKMQAELDRLRSGASQSPQGRSAFARGAAEYAAEVKSDPSYWTKPTEMLARSFEAYVAHKVEAIGGTTEFIAKGDDAYLSDADSRLAKTFPKDSDRYNIFRAYDLLFDAIREQALLNPGGEAVANVPANQRITNPLVHYQAQIDSSTSERVAQAWQEERQAFEKRRHELDRLAARPKDPRTLGQRLMDAPAAVIFTNRGVMLTLEERYRRNGNAQAAEAIRNIAKRLATDPGAGRETIEGGTYAEAVFLETTRRLNRLGNIVKSNNLDKYTDAQLAELTDVLTSVGDEGAKASPEILKAANELRNLMDSTYYYNMNSGMDIGYVADVGYLPRMLDNPVVMEAGQQFVNDAAKVYEIVFDRDTMRASDEGVDIGEAINALMKRIQEARLDPKNDVELAALGEAIKELRKLTRELDRATASEDGDAIDAAQAALNQFMEDNMSVFDEAFDYVKAHWAQQAAADWQARILYGSPENFSSHSPQGSFTKRRVLPKEADKILARYYIQNPVERISRYIEASVRKSEYTRLFGNGQLNAQMRTLAKAKVMPEDQQIIRDIVGQVTGTDESRVPERFKRMASNIHAVGNMTLLGRVVLTSLVEQMTIALQTGKPLDAFLATAMTIREGFNTKTVREQRAIADLLGIVGGDMTQEIISNRLGGTMGESAAMQKISSNFFRRVGLTGLTNAQRRVSMQLSGRYIMELAADVDTLKDGNQKRRFALDELRDAGLTDAEVQDFVAWTREFRDRLPGIHDLTDGSGELTRMGKLYGLMVGRLVNQSIQNPTAVDRPWAANTVVGRMAYGLLSFSMGFMRNVIIKNIKKVQREYEAQGAAGAAKVAALQVAAPLMSLYMGHLLVTVAREALLNPERWEEKEADGKLVEWLLLLAFSRAGFTGLADPLYNAVLGVKYQRDLANILAGASGGYFLQALQRITSYFFINSENTNSAERSAVRGLYELLVQPAAAIAVGGLAAGPMLGYGMGLSYAYLSSPRAKSNVQDIVAGEADSGKARTGQGGRAAPVF